MTAPPRLSLLALCTALVACGEPVAPAQSSFDRALASCIREGDAPGSYTANQAVLTDAGIPRIEPAAGGTIRGAVLLGACVEARMAASATTPTTVIKTRTAPATATGPNLGGLPLPTQYTLLPGDAELWPTLTRAEQDRALLFLKDGSTIQSSLNRT